MDEKTRGILIGVVIIVIGCLSLLTNLDIIPFGENLFWAGLFLLLTYLFYRAYQKDHSRWWGLASAGICLFLGIVFIFEAIPILPNDLIGTILFWIGAAVFITVYAQNSQNWWALIPAGCCIVLGFIVMVDELNLLDADFIPFILFLGIGLTFGFLYGIRDENNRLDWAKYPAVFITLFSFFLLAMIETSVVGDLLLPAGLIVVGGILIYRAFRNK